MEDIIRKIRKLIALSESPNEHEAKLAMDMVNELLDKYNLSLSQVSDSIPDEFKESIVSEGKGPLNKWKTSLMTGIAESYYCTLLYQSHHFWNKMILVGKTINIEATIIMYNYLHDVINRLAKEYTNDLSVRTSYQNGIVYSLNMRLCERMQRNKTIEEKALVVLRDDEKKKRDDFINKNHNVHINNNNNNIVTDESFFHGVDDGRNISLDSQIGVTNEM